MLTFCTGNWIGSAHSPSLTLETAEARLEGEDKATFLAFMRKMLQWRPEDRTSAESLIADEWLLKDFIESGALAHLQ